MRSDSSPYEPAYVAIADHYRQQIKAGDLAAGDKLPSERVICERWGVSTITARAALTALRNEGLVYGVKGKGTFVREVKPLVRIAPHRYFRPHDRPTYVIEAERAGRDLDVQHKTRKVPASVEVAERLSIDEGDLVTETAYLIKMGGQPVSSSFAWEPIRITGGTPIELPHKGPYANRGIVPRFDAIGFTVTRVDEILNIRMPEPQEAATLQVPQGVPVVRIKQTFWAGDIPVETADIVFPGDRYELHYLMDIPEQPDAPSTGEKSEGKAPTMDSGWEHID
ncbi:GntR family transcriptional regulator [Actinomadura madurae]|uniref:GntR family transcriptional regulator n=1 Tax=Actinomadura madurae TaxID=1993 RepID=A0A1I5M1Q1_9ACTN|nr:GntR family transcriptional regulator [Actinomadura madurae]SFP03472.1 GntR family transcriptional regulator [Actinomadura madurae]